jgi:molecular chaperone GrpE
MYTIRTLLPILDDFERALRVAPEGDEFAKGMSLIYQRLSDALNKLGVEPITSVGQPFDPRLHEAISMDAGDGGEEIVSEELQAGYAIGDHVIRHAMVRVKG